MGNLSGVPRSEEGYDDAAHSKHAATHSQVYARAALLHISLKGSAQDDVPLSEFLELARASDTKVCGLYRVHCARPSPKYFIGSGKAQQLKEQLQRDKVRLLITSRDLSPSQERNLERLCCVRVLGRSGLILDIFSQRARSHEGKLQVELAQLNYLATRLVRGWSHLERQKGGIGLRGPGEKQLETDRRLISRRVGEINKRLKRVKSRRYLGRRMRKRRRLVTVALVGYTNAGKTALFNRLTGASSYSASRLFATLDPMMRRLDLSAYDGKSAGGWVGSRVLSDTVGFISNLPPALIEAFNATLLEVCEADLLLHVVDAAALERDKHQHALGQVLCAIGADRIPMLTVLNKSDLTRQLPAVVRNSEGRPLSVTVSAATGVGIEPLKRAIAELTMPRMRCYETRIPSDAGGLRSFAYTHGEVIREEYQCGKGWRLQLRLADSAAGSLLKHADNLGYALELSELSR